MQYNGLPLFSFTVDDYVTGVEKISIVDNPAVQSEFIALSAEDVERFKLSADPKRHIVTGVALFPDQKIIRRAADGSLFYIQFSKEAIEAIALKFFREHNGTATNLMHSVDTDGATLFESYLVDRSRGILPVEFNDAPDGTWVVSMKIENDKLWELIEDGKLRGFSIEGSFREVKTEYDNLEKLMNDLIENK